MHLHLFGSPQFTYQGKPVTGFVSNKARALLIYLAVTGRAHSRDALSELLWADTPISKRANLKQALSNLRNRAGITLIEEGQHSVALDPASYWTDVAEFERLARDATHADAARSDVVDDLQRAALCYQGDFLTGFPLSLSAEFETWALGEQTRLRTRLIEVLRRLADVHTQRAEFPQAIATVRHLLQLEPWREEAHCQLMELLARTGNRSAALAHFEECVFILADELAVVPSATTVALVTKIRNDTYAIATTRPLSVTPSALHPAEQASVDLLEMPDAGLLCGREDELAQLKQWIVDDERHLCAILGVGGVGKTSLAARFVGTLLAPPENLASSKPPFDKILWRSLLNAPPLADILQQSIRFLSAQRVIDLPTSLDAQLRQLTLLLQQQRCLLILDNAESIMQVDHPLGVPRAGAYRAGYAGYGQLIQRIAQGNHQSCLLLTSRESPHELVRLRRDSTAVCSLQLRGLPDAAAQQLLVQQGLVTVVTHTSPLIQRYSGHPLALKLVAETINELYFGDVDAFLAEKTFIFAEIGDVLDQHFARLSPMEEAILTWLAIEREPISVQALGDNLLDSMTQRTYLESLRALQQRSLLERQEEGFTLQNVVMEYVTERFINQLCQALKNDELTTFDRHALLKARSKDYVRESQSRMLLQPVATRLVAHYGQTGLETKLREWLNRLRVEARNGYAAGNILHLLLHLGSDLRGCDFSSLTIRQAYLQGMALHDVNFHAARLKESVFSNTFGNILSVAFSPDGSLFAAATAYDRIWVWQTSNGQLLMIGEGHTSWVWSVCFSPDGQLLATAGSDHVIGLWDIRTSRRIATVKGHIGSVNSVCFSPDGTILASGGDDQMIRLWDVQSGQLLSTVEGHLHRVWSVVFSPDGKFLASGSQDQTVRLWDIGDLGSGSVQPQGTPSLSESSRAGRLLKTFQGHSGSVISVAFSPDGRTLASGGNDQVVHLWDVGDSLVVGQPLRTFQGHANKIRSVAFNVTGTLLASSSEDWTIYLWDVGNTLSTEQPLLTLQEHTDVVSSVCFSPDGRLLLSGSWDQSVRLWDTQTGKSVKTLGSYTNRIWDLAFSPDGKTLASGNDDTTIRLWDALSGTLLKTFTNPTGTVRRIVFSPDGKTLASCGFEHYVRLWDIASEQLHETVLQHTARVVDISFAPDGQILAGTTIDKTVCLWDVRTGQRLTTLQGQANDKGSICFSPDGKMLACGEDDGQITLWDIDAQHIRTTLSGHHGRVPQVTFSPDGKLLASAGEDWTTRLWDVQTGQALSKLQGHTHEIYAVCFSPDGKLLASASIDKTVRLWNITAILAAETKQAIAILDGHTDRVFAIDFSPNGALLASGGDDGAIKLWDVQTRECFDSLRHDRPYERMNITGITGITDAQRVSLKALGAIDLDTVTRCYSTVATP